MNKTSDYVNSIPSPTQTSAPVGYCAACKYNLRGLPSGLCPECGRAFSWDDSRTFLESLHRRLFAWPTLLAFGPLVLSAYLTPPLEGTGYYPSPAIYVIPLCLGYAALSLCRLSLRGRAKDHLFSRLMTWIVLALSVVVLLVLLLQLGSYGYKLLFEPVRIHRGFW